MLLGATGVTVWAKPWCGLLCIEAWIVPCDSVEIASFSRPQLREECEAVPLIEAVDSEAACGKGKEPDPDGGWRVGRIASVLADEGAKPRSSCSTVSDSPDPERSSCVDGITVVPVDKLVKSWTSSVVVKGSSTVSLKEIDVISEGTASNLSTEETWLIETERVFSCDDVVG